MVRPKVIRRSEGMKEERELVTFILMNRFFYNKFIALFIYQS